MRGHDHIAKVTALLWIIVPSAVGGADGGGVAAGAGRCGVAICSSE